MKRLASIALLLSLCLAACGVGNEITLKTDGMRFIADEVHVKAGQPVALRVVNQDGYAHAFDLDAFAIHAPLPANTTYTATFTPTQPGRYRFYCGAPGHVDAGMVGELVVEP